MRHEQRNGPQNHVQRSDLAEQRKRCSAYGRLTSSSGVAAAPKATSAQKAKKRNCKGGRRGGVGGREARREHGAHSMSHWSHSVQCSAVTPQVKQIGDKTRMAREKGRELESLTQTIR